MFVYDYECQRWIKMPSVFIGVDEILEWGVLSVGCDQSRCRLHPLSWQRDAVIYPETDSQGTTDQFVIFLSAAS